MTRIIVLCVAALVALLPAARGDVMFDKGPVGLLGLVLRPNSNASAMVQPFQTRMSGWADRIGIGIASGADPNSVGFKVTLTDTNLVTLIPGTPIAGSWNLIPVSGPTLAYAYTDIEPVFLDHNQIYGLVVEPGDEQMYGSVAYAYGGAGWATSDGWATNFRLPYSTCLRVYGTPVPEPSSLLVLSGAGAALALSARRRRLR